MNDTLVNRLICPRSQKPLRLLSDSEWQELKTRLNQEQVSTAFDALITPQGGAVCKGETLEELAWFYPLAEGLLYLMPNDAVELS